MSRLWIRRLAVALGALLLLALVAAGVLVATFDANRYKRVAIDWMKTEHQRTLAIDGPIQLALFPRLAIEVSKLRLSERARSDEFAAIDEAALALQLLPLLHRQVVVDRISARGVRAVYSRGADGKRNIDDLAGGNGGAGTAPAAATPSPPTGGGAAAVRFDIGAVRLDDVQLRVRDAIGKIDGDIALQSLSAGALAWDGSAARAGPLKLALKSLTLGTTTLGASSLDARQLLWDTAGQRLELDALKAALTGRHGANLPFELTLDWPQLTVDAHSLKGSALSGRWKAGGPDALHGTLRSGAPSGRFDALRLPGLTLDVQGRWQGRKVDGALKADFMLDAGRGAVALEPLDLKATLGGAGAPPLQLAVRGKASADARQAAWTLDGALDANRFASSGSAAFGAAVPTVKASARFDSLDLNQLGAASDGKPGAANAPAPTGPAPADAPVALDGLNAVNGRFSLTAGTLAWRQYRASDVKLDASLDSGLLRIARLTGRAWGGAIDASGSVDARRHRIAVKLAADGVDVNALLKNVAGKDILEGTGHVDADVNTGGATVGALRSALAGTVSLRVRDGAVKGINLARTLRQAKAALAMKTDAVSRASTTEKTDFSELTASARIADGVAVSDDLDVRSPFLRIGGAGRFDIGHGTIDYTARATVVETSKGQEGADLAALKGLQVPVRLTGPFDAIAWKVEWSGVAAKALEHQLKDKLSERLGLKPAPAAPAASAAAPAPPRSDKDRLRDELKKLLGR